MISTWISDEEAKLFSTVEDKELNELFQEVRKEFNSSYLIQTIRYDERTWLDRLTSNYLKTGKRYTLYFREKGIDAQVVNFCQDHDWSINTSVPKSYIMTFFFGLLSGKDWVKNGHSH